MTSHQAEEHRQLQKCLIIVHFSPHTFHGSNQATVVRMEPQDHVLESFRQI